MARAARRKDQEEQAVRSNGSLVRRGEALFRASQNGTPLNFLLRAPRPLPPVRAAVPAGRPQALNSEAARERRRQAILAAMNENAGSETPVASVAVPSKPPVQVLPSLPSLSSSKRALPWESDGQ